MDYKVIWSDAAISDLYEICSHIAKSDPEAAQLIGEAILGHAQVLESFPFIGRSYPRGAQARLREIVYRAYRIFYDVSEPLGTVEILHVRHGARDEPQM